jgi:hypothetical protein
MAKRRGKTSARRTLDNQRRLRLSFMEMLGFVNRRAHEQANRRTDRRDQKSMPAVIAATDVGEDTGGVEWTRRLIRWLTALVLLPLCWVTTWTFLSRFSLATEQGFWQTAKFWYFATGVLVMAGWFWSGLLQPFFLYLYVLGHELTHAVFVVFFRGKVTDFHVSTEGGYIMTNKTNLVIALSPYFVPIWAVIGAVLYAALRFCVVLTPAWDLAFYAVMGVTWTFHMVWTVWMLPRDQPDLKEQGTLLSLVVIYQANLLVLVALLCLAEKAPLESAREFAREWLRHAMTWGDVLWRTAWQAISELRTTGKF